MITKKRIVTSGRDTQQNHRGDFETCPNCGHRMEYKEWCKSHCVLILSPTCYKSGSVSVMSECPKCFKNSWVHLNMSRFEYDDAWPKDWQEEVKKLDKSTKLTALRDWGASLCWNCRHLTGGAVEYNAWRYCKLGSGPCLTKCKVFKPVPAPGKRSSKSSP